MSDERTLSLDAAFRRALGLEGAADPKAEARRRDAAALLARVAEKALEDGRSELAALLCLGARRAGAEPDDRLEGVLRAAFASVFCVRVVPDAHQGGVSAVAWSPDGEMLASGGGDARVALRSGAGLDEAVVLPGHEDRVRRVEFNGVWPLLSSCGDDGAAIVWDIAERRELWRAQGLDASALAARFSSCGRWAAVAGGVEWSGLRDARTGALLFAFGRHDGIVVYDAAFSPDGRLVATCGDDGRAIVWDIGSGAVLHEIRHRRPARSVDFDQTGGRVASAAYDGSATVLSLADGARRSFEADGRQARWARFLAGDRLWIGYDGGDELVVELSPGAVEDPDAIARFHAAPVQAIWVETDGGLIAAADHGGLICVRRVTAGEIGTTASLRSAGAGFQALDLTADGRRVAAGDGDGALHLWALDWEERARRSALRGEPLWQAVTEWRKTSGRAPTRREIELVAGDVGTWLPPDRG